MAKSTVDSAAAKTAEELKNMIKKLVKAIVDDDDAKAETFEETSRALSSLRDIYANNGDGSKKKDGGIEPVQIPKHFLCPISSEIMRDPVVLSSGQTYDRPFIREWLNSGKRTCPQTKQVLTDPTLTPNRLVRSMISQWCTEHGIALPMPKDNPDEPPVPATVRNSVISLLQKLSSTSVPVKKEALEDLRLLTKKQPSARAFFGENPEAISKLLSVISTPGLDGDRGVHEDAVTTVLNISLFEGNKKILGDDQQAILFLIEAVKTGTMQTKGNAAAALFSLAALDSNKSKIGELGALKPLIALLASGTLEAKKDAANAIFSLCTNRENKARAATEGLAVALMPMIMDKRLEGELLAILALVSVHKKVAEEIVEIDGVACLLQIIRESSCPQNKENAVAILYSICVDHRMKLRGVEEDETMQGTISDLVNTGTLRARRKATGILERLRKTTHSTHYSC